MGGDLVEAWSARAKSSTAQRFGIFAHRGFSGRGSPEGYGVFGEGNVKCAAHASGIIPTPAFGNDPHGTNSAIPPVGVRGARAWGGPQQDYFQLIRHPKAKMKVGSERMGRINRKI